MISQSNQPCPHCKGKNFDCGMCLGSGKNPAGMATTVTKGGNGDQTAQIPASLAAVLRDDIRKPLTPESLQGDPGASESDPKPTNFEELIAYLEHHPWCLVKVGDAEPVYRRFKSANDQGLWWTTRAGDMRFLPINFADAHPAILNFDENGFSATKFNQGVRHTYVDGPTDSSQGDSRASAEAPKQVPTTWVELLEYLNRHPKLVCFQLNPETMEVDSQFRVVFREKDGDSLLFECDGETLLPGQFAPTSLRMWLKGPSDSPPNLTIDANGFEFTGRHHPFRFEYREGWFRRRTEAIFDGWKNVIRPTSLPSFVISMDEDGTASVAAVGDPPREELASILELMVEGIRDGHFPLLYTNPDEAKGGAE